MTGDAPAPPATDRLMAATDATWPAAEVLDFGGWRLRSGAGGGKRVSAASPLAGGGSVEDAETVMRDWKQPPLFRLTQADQVLDGALQARGYRELDRVVLYAGLTEALAGEGSHVAAVYRVRGVPAILEEIWTAGGIGPGRLAVMERAAEPSINLLSRADDTPCGAAFVALDGDVAMIHAIEVLDRLRRQGAGRLLIEGAARFAAEHGASWLALAVTEANAPARALYGKLGMVEAGNYHYRIAPDASETT